MFFDTPVYIVFLVVVTVLYWGRSRISQNVLLLGASYFFYGWWDWRFLILIATSTFVDYHCAHAIDGSQNVRKRRLLLTLSLLVNFGFLGVFKYFNFFEGSLIELLKTMGIGGVNRTILAIVLPPGISFYTFQEVAYIVDVYDRRLKPAKSIIDYALFISLFPHLIAGPIQRPSHLLPQVQNPRKFDGDRFFSGLMLILSGLFRKCVIADNCALLANAAFGGKLGHPSLLVVLIGTYAFAWQIYGDFSGYSDIARGSAQLLGFHFMVNFRQPYLATSLQDFWRRWHISLSTWLRDYLYIPLGGNRQGEAKTLGNLMTTMLLGGLWHGANWTFVVWGALHGVGLAIERVVRKLITSIFGRQSVTNGSVPQADLQPSRPRIPRIAASPTAGDNRNSLTSPTMWIRRIVVFHFVCLAWVFFRGTSIHDALTFLGGLKTFQWRPEFATAIRFLALFSVPMFLIDLLNERRGEEYVFERIHEAVRIGVAVVMFVMITFLAGNELNAFIYFQF
jgi:alginate O-acetyltransferase complex protein AlgI